MAEKKGRDNQGDRGIRIARAEFVAGAARPDQVPTPTHFENAPEVAFAGRSNVGKSSLLNMLLARKGLARTSNTPGCTRQINFFDVGIAKASVVSPSPRVIFVDLPGYGYAKVSKTEGKAWQELLEGYLQARPTLRGVFILVDVRRGIEQEENDLIEFLGERSDRFVKLVATKLDKLSRNAQKPALAKLAQAGAGKPIGTSAETGDGREEVWSLILGACGMERSSG